MSRWRLRDSAASRLAFQQPLGASRSPRGDLIVVAFVAVVLCAAPTVGDVGGCGVQATSLDQRSFAAARKRVDCQRCNDCNLQTQTCKAACNPAAPGDVVWPSTCLPLLHDGDVCIRALQAASCSSYASFVDDTAPTEPTECDFCHLLADAGQNAAGEL